MSDGVLPAALAIAALSLLLGFAPRRTAALALLVAGLLAIGVSLSPLPSRLIDAAFLSCWIVTASTALLTWLPNPPRPPIALALAGLVGTAAGAVVAAGADASPSDVLRALPAALLVIPASLAVERGYPLVPRVVASWLIAVALLAAILPYAVTTPGYVPDHMG